MRRVLSARVAAIEASPTLAVTTAAKLLRAAGEHVIGFGAGEPDFPTPTHVVAAAQEAATRPEHHRYSPVGGLPDLREAVAADRRDGGLDVDASQVVVSNGGKHALAQVFLALLDPGDEVLLPAPYWVTYPEQIALAGGRTVPVLTDPADGFRVRVEQLEAARTARTRALVFVSPSNPTGAVVPPDEVERIGRWAAEHDLWVVTDEIYRHLVYGDAVSVSMPVVVPELAPRCVVVDGVAKTYAMTGWRVGWSISPPELAAGIARLQSHLTSNVANVAQVAALAALTGPQDAAQEMLRAFDRRRRTAVEMLAKMDGVQVVEPEGAFYVFPTFADVLGSRLAGRTVVTTLDLVEVLLEQARVALVPGEAFGVPGGARISYALSDEDLEEGLARIGDLLAGRD